jgi:hypothetical protein
MSLKEFDKIHKILKTLRKDTDMFVEGASELLKATTGEKYVILDLIVEAKAKKPVRTLLAAIGYKKGDTLRSSIDKLENYIINGQHFDNSTYKVLLNDTLRDAFGFSPEIKEISYEKLMGKLPKLFR